MSVLAPRQASDITLPFANEGRWLTAVSDNDASVNFIRTLAPGQMMEARYVRRREDYVAAYVSSHLGCAMACRFCHLTQSHQRDMMPVGAEGFMEQAALVLRYYAKRIAKGEGRASKVNYNFMARGEPLANATIMQRPGALVEAMSRLAGSYGLKAQFNFSTILPEETADFDLAAFNHLPITLYYSLYSLDKHFRKRWLPRAQDPLKALDRLAAYQEKTGNDIVLHWALIKGENDKAKNAHDITKALAARGIKARFNLVEYNPYTKRQGEEASKAAHRNTLNAMAKGLGEENVRQIPRVGYDVKASCGMFMTGHELDRALKD